MSLEKLEMIGDSVLKLVVTCHLFTHFPSYNEGRMTALKNRLISNRHLFAVAMKKNLGSYLAGSLFEPETSWLPPGVRVPENVVQVSLENDSNYDPFFLTSRVEDEVFKNIDLESCDDEQLTSRILNPSNPRTGPLHTSYTHSKMKQKSIADGVEALIGAYYVNGGIGSAVRFMDWIGLRGFIMDPVDSKKFISMPYKTIPELPVVTPDYPVSEDPESVLPFIGEVEKVLNYR